MLYPEYVHTSSPNTTVEQSEISWGEQHVHGLTIVETVVKIQAQPGDQVMLRWYDSNGNSFGSSTISGTVCHVTPPAGTYGAKLILTSSSATGDRWAWRHSGTNSAGNTSFCPDPDLTSTTGVLDELGDVNSTLLVLSDVLSQLLTELQSQYGSVTVDFSAVLGELESINSSLGTVNNRLDSVVSGLDSVVSGLDSVVSGLDTVNSNLETVNNRLDSVVSGLDTVNSNLEIVNNRLDSVISGLDTIDSHVVDIYDYFSTPRTPQAFSIDMPNMSIDSTPPAITEPHQQPYTYDRPTQQFEMAPFVDSPSPLPIIPEPTIMPHEPPSVIDQPLLLDQPVNVNPPLQLDPVIISEPLTMDPPKREEPLPITPIERDQVLDRQQPLGTDSPITPDPPITPSPPL
ncbi:MAG: hypothetical protein PHY48_15495 [Candidatus Cloacimonetes bacterium]|nr:hypothetical protein [Candidatus Cloacimonadota bacterium]